MYRNKLLSFYLVVTVAACTPRNQPAIELEPTLTPIRSSQGTSKFLPTSTPTLIPLTATPTSTMTSIPPTATAIPLPVVSEEYLPYTIYYLRTRSYGGGQIEILELIEEREKFTHYEIRYPSDELNIYGFANVPKGDGPFPIIVMLHGYGKSRAPAITEYASTLSDVFAENGYIVLHPNMRGYPPSDSGDNRYRVGLAIDVLNLVALVNEQSNQPGLLANAESTRIGMWGQSLGGGVALRVATVSKDVKAMVLYSAISGDEIKNAELFYALTEEQSYLTEMETPPDVIAYISPLNYFDTINASVKLYHSTGDDVVPMAWAMETCDEMKARNIDVDCVYYIGTDHTFAPNFQADLRNTTLAFFDTNLKEP